MYKRMLAVLLICGLLAGAFCLPASAETQCNCGKVIYITTDGFGATLYYNQDTPAETVAGMVNTDAILPVIPKVLGQIVLSFILFNADWFSEALTDLVMAMMGHLCLDTDGNSIAPVGSRWHIDEKDHTQPNRDAHYTFNYDFRIDPYSAAAELNSFIEALCAKTGHAKVALHGHSEGAAVAVTYLSEYGSGRLDSLVLTNGAWQGLTLVGELLTYQIALSPKAVSDYIGTFDDGSGQLKTAFEWLYRLRILDFVKPLGEAFMTHMGDKLYEDLLMPLFCNMGAVWSFVPASYYEEARKMIANRPEYAKILETSDTYHREIQANAGDLLKAAQADGVKVAVIASYGYKAIPVTGDTSYMCDNLIDTRYEAGLAMTAKNGEKLPADPNNRYLSPDRLIDASTCLLPDNTWFISGNNHDAGAADGLVQWLIYADGQPTVDSNPDYPQFLQKIDGKAVPLK